MTKEKMIDLLCHGGCQIFAYKMAEKTSWPIVYIGSKYANDFWVEHAVLESPFGFIDAQGRISQNKIQSIYNIENDDYIQKNVTINDVKKDIKNSDTWDFLHRNQISEDMIDSFVKKVANNHHIFSNYG